MNKLRSYILFFSFLFLIIEKSFSQATIIFENTSDFPDTIQQHLFVAGNFNNWDPAAPKYQLHKLNGVWQITFTPDAALSVIEFKFTHGSWTKGEIMKDGSFKANRNYTYQPGMVLHESVESFEDLTAPKIREANKNIIQFKIYSPELKREKNIRVYLPCDYATSKKTYSVLYMLDGQNLFDDVYAFAGEWGIDECLDTICAQGKTSAIIIGIDNAGEQRLTEYSPWIMSRNSGGGDGDEFSDFVANTLKHSIDSMYRTRPERAFNGVAGSSMGGLESLYIALDHNETFGMAGIFSPAFWTSDENFKYAEKYQSALPLKLYFICGAWEGGDSLMMSGTEKMYSILLNKKIPSLELRMIIESSGQHTESFWRSEFYDAYEWMFGR